MRHSPLLVAVLLCASTAFAQSEPTEWCVTNLAQRDRAFYTVSPSIGSERWRVLDGAAFVERVDGTAVMTAAIVNTRNSAERFSVMIELSGRIDAGEPVPAGSPKIESPIAPLLVSQGGPIDPETWRYYPEFAGNMIGQVALEGAELRLEPKGPAFQVGFGANNKDASFGASSWFSLDLVSQPNSGRRLDLTHGDINASLEICECRGGEWAFSENYGIGLAGCDGVPSLGMPNLPLTGSTPRIAVGGGSETRSCAMIWGAGPAANFIPFLGGTLLIDPILIAMTFELPPSGYVFECAIPENPCAVGADYYLQVICIDPCGPAGFSMSRGLRIHLGDL